MVFGAQAEGNPLTNQNNPLFVQQVTMNYGHPASQGPARSNPVRGHQVGDPATNQMAGFLRKNPTYGPGSRNNREYHSQQHNGRNKNNYHNNQDQFNDHTNQQGIPEARNWNNDRSRRGWGKNRSSRIENAQANFNHQSGPPNDQFVPRRQRNRGPNPRSNPQHQSTTAQGYNKDHRPGWGYYNSSASGQDWQQGRRNKQNKNQGIQKPGANSSQRQHNPNLDAHLWKVSCGEDECWKDTDGDVVMSEAPEDDPWTFFNVSRTYGQVM